MIHDLHFLILTFLHKNLSFSLPLPSEAIAIDELGLIAPKLHTYTNFFLLYLQASSYRRGPIIATRCFLEKSFMKFNNL